MTEIVHTHTHAICNILYQSYALTYLARTRVFVMVQISAVNAGAATLSFVSCDPNSP